MLSSKLFTEVLRKSRTLLSAAIFLLVAPVALHATPVTYDLTLTETDPVGTTTFSGTGSVTLDITGAPVGFTQYTIANGLKNLEFTVDGQNFSLADAQSGPATVIFEFGDVADLQIRDITFAETNANGDRISSTSGYIYYQSNVSVSGNQNTGTFTASLAPVGHGVSAVPEPGSLSLLGTGMLAGAGTLFRRYRLHRS
jgi:hypothetical protein